MLKAIGKGSNEDFSEYTLMSAVAFMTIINREQWQNVSCLSGKGPSLFTS